MNGPCTHKHITGPFLSVLLMEQAEVKLQAQTGVVAYQAFCDEQGQQH